MAVSGSLQGCWALRFRPMLLVYTTRDRAKRARIEARVDGAPPPTQRQKNRAPTWRPRGIMSLRRRAVPPQRLPRAHGADPTVKKASNPSRLTSSTFRIWAEAQLPDQLVGIGGAISERLRISPNSPERGHLQDARRSNVSGNNRNCQQARLCHDHPLPGRRHHNICCRRLPEDCDSKRHAQASFLIAPRPSAIPPTCGADEIEGERARKSHECPDAHTKCCPFTSTI